MKAKNAVFFILFILFILGGCATTPQLTNEQALSQSKELTDFNNRLTEAKSNGVNYLSPDNFKEAEDQYSSAIKDAMAQKFDSANEAAVKGQESLSRAETAAGQSREIFADVLVSRDCAIAAEGPELYSEDYEDIESVFHKATVAVEEGKLDKAKDYRPELLKGYSDIELKALKKDTVSDAQSVLDHAKKLDVDDYAPKTLKLAQDELNVAVSLLDTDREATEKANEHAARSIWLAERAINITELAKDFKRRDFENEDVLLWYQDQLTALSSPLNKDLPFDKPNAEVIDGLQKDISGIVASNADLSAKLAQASDEMTQQQQKLEGQMGSEKQQMAASQQLQQENQARFEFVQSLFDPAEARVFTQRQNVIIAAQGFYFPSGKSEIDTVNFSSAQQDRAGHQ